MNDWKLYKLDLPKRIIVYKRTYIGCIDHKRYTEYNKYKIRTVDMNEQYVTTQYSNERLYFDDFEKIIY